MSSEKSPTVKELYFSYFIGRCNPPHQGHFHMIREAILAANNNGGKSLILLGSGPKAKYGIDRRTEKDPLPFDFKKKIIVKNITNCHADEETTKDNNEDDTTTGIEIEFESNYEIVEMTNPTAQVIEFVETELKSHLINDEDTSVIKITVHHFAGAKDNDAIKLEFVRKALENRIKEEYNVHIETEPVTFCLDIEDKDIPLSAKSIRDYAYSANNDFVKEYLSLYGEDTEHVYDGIIEGKKYGEKMIQAHTQSKTKKRKAVCKLKSVKIKKCENKSIPKGGKRKTKKQKTSKRRKTNKRKRRKTKRTKKEKMV
mgnify:CR=1 FL=1|jgi:hypothetical protein